MNKVRLLIEWPGWVRLRNLPTRGQGIIRDKAKEAGLKVWTCREKISGFWNDASTGINGCIERGHEVTGCEKRERIGYKLQIGTSQEQQIRCVQP